MNVIVLIPSHTHSESAGLRIRYGRLAEALSRLGIRLALTAIESFDPLKADCNVVILSKCYDARGLLVEALLSQRGIPVGLDLFDDYFSQAKDSRLGRFRSWLSQALRLADFAVCSTPAMASVTSRYRSDIPVHILNDPAPAFDQLALAEGLSRKIAVAKSEGILRVCWFGIGDNPFFPVGLSDLFAFSSDLRALASAEIPVELTILTNRRALNAEGLSMIARLPLAATIKEWSIKCEADVLGRSMLCYLPVNGQLFSAAKSLNRALTALSSGCQVLSAGYPIYSAVEQFIYRDAGTFLDDFSRGFFKLSPATVGSLVRKIDEVGSIDEESTRLANFLAEITSNTTEQEARRGTIYLINGYSTSASAHALVKAAGGLSIGTPFCTAPLDFDVIVKLSARGEQAIFVSERARSRLSARWRRQAASMQRFRRRKFWQVTGNGASEQNGDTRSAPLPLQLARYKSVMHEISAILPELFGPGCTVVSENSQLPLEMA